MGNTEKERISREAGNPESWICICGNRPIDHGFFACDTDGNEMMPSIGSDWKNLYVCAKCGRIIDQITLQVVGRNPSPKMLA